MRSVGINVPVTLVTLVVVLKAAAAAVQPRPGCTKSCGNQSIPFPFGTSPDCYLDDSFYVTCNNTYDGPKPFLKGKVQLFNISLEGSLLVSSSMAHDCYNASGIPISVAKSFLGFDKFSVSATRNKINVVGCDTYAFVQSLSSTNITTGCPAWCNSLENVKNGSCFGVGCCQMDIPKGVRGFELISRSLMNHTRSQSFNPCGFAFVAEEGYYNFSSTDLMDFQNEKNLSFPVLIDWAVANLTCKAAQRNGSSYACRSKNSECRDSRNGYYCSCQTGFEGNPYLVDGCLDINECETSNPCTGICTNSAGTFSCSCPEGYEGDGKKEGIGCRRKSKDKGPIFLYVALGVILGILLLLAGGTWIYFVMRKRKLLKMREKFFHKNGGLLLQQKLFKRTGSMEKDITFTEEVLKKSTNNFDDKTIIGHGGSGTVYKGLLPDNRVIAIKRSKVSDQSQIEQFINEVVILSQINHRNVVKLLGCCLETEVPLLVYEFIPSGTLYHHIQDKRLSSKLTWELRLKIAAETAEAVAYLHSATSVPIVHRDIKSGNILLDNNYTAKVSDFGASRFIPTDQAQVTTLVQGTLGYLDPEYFHSSQLTTKSDVYSFGVVLAELITGEKALSFSRSDTERNLAMYFVSLVEENKLFRILGEKLVQEGNDQQLRGVARLAKRCLSVKSEERPTMKEVSVELQALRVMYNNRGVNKSSSPRSVCERSKSSLSFNSIDFSLNFSELESETFNSLN